MSGGQDYVQRLGRVLRRQDPTALREFLAEHAARFGDERQVAEIRNRDAAAMEELLHRMIVARADLTDLHAASERWLAAHGGAPSGHLSEQPGRGREGARQPPDRPPRRPRAGPERGR